MCCEIVVKVVSLLWLNFHFIRKSLHNKITTSPRHCCNNRELVIGLVNFLSLQQVYNRSTKVVTSSKHLQHVRNSLRIWKHLHVICKTIPQPLQHVHNKLTIDTQQENTITTTRLGFLQQPHNNTTTSPQNSRQVHDHCNTTRLQQVHNIMIYMETRLQIIFFLQFFQ